MLEDINLNYYRVFYAVAISGSIKKASTLLNISQPGISKQIKNLEQELDAKLFYRNNKGIELTIYGQQVFKYLDDANFYFSSIKKHINSLKKSDEGDIIIGCQSHIATFYLLKYIEMFKKDYPKFKITIVSDSTSILLEKLYNHSIDFVIDNSPVNCNYSNIKIEPLKSFNTCFIKRKDYNGDNYNLILPLPRSSIRKNIDGILNENKISHTVSLEVETTELIKNTTNSYLGVGYIIEEAVNEELSSGKFIKCNTDIVLPKLEINLVYIENHLTYISKIFITKYLKDQSID